MSKYRKAIARYEKARQEVRRLEKKRYALLNSCTFPVGTEHDPVIESCLQRVYRKTGKLNSENPGDHYSFDEVLFSGTVTCCDNCLESRKIKKGPLAEAKLEFGNAKRQLSWIGKSILKEK